MDIYDKKLVNMIETRPLCAFSSNLADINHDEMMNPIDFRGRRSRSQYTHMLLRM